MNFSPSSFLPSPPCVVSLLPSFMSILMGSVYTSSVVLSPSAQTILSQHFASSRFLLHTSSVYAFTINGGPHGSFTTVLECAVSSSLTTDVSLSLDWKASRVSMQEWFIGLGLNPTNGFELENLNLMPRGEFLHTSFHPSLVSLH
jgi:hypothetical protein